MVDKIEIEILEDGTIKMSTDKVSMPNHANAEGLIRQISADAGGEVTRTRTKKAGLHHHGHAHEHDGHWHTH